MKAAENGVVAYAGDELKGYGNLVLIRHSNNWVSAYAHNEEILVKRGDQVRRGQVIAKAGRTGQVNQPQLHFELRKGSRPVDPDQVHDALHGERRLASSAVEPHAEAPGHILDVLKATRPDRRRAPIAQASASRVSASSSMGRR